MSQVKVKPGICGFDTTIEIKSEDMQNATIEGTTQCPSILKLMEELKEVDGFSECFGKFGDSKTFELAKKHCQHPSCPIPSAILKGIEVECGLALPQTVEMEITKE